MRIEFDPAKNEWNIRTRGIAFSDVERFAFDTALRVEDTRKEYGETRIIAYGMLDGRLHVLCFKPLGALHIRVISLRKANNRERNFYEKTHSTLD